MPGNSSGEKTEKATPKKRQDARKEGQVRKSNELNIAFMVLLMFAALNLLTPYLSTQLIQTLNNYYSPDFLGASRLSQINTQALFLNVITQFLTILAPLLAIAFIGGILINVLQVGWNFTTKAITPKFSKINPLSGFKRLFSMQSVVDLIKSILKLTVLIVIVYGEYKARLEAMSNLMILSVAEAAGEMFSMIMDIAFKCGLALAIIGIADFAYQSWKYAKDLRMTKQEVKDENKQLEGNPQTKGRIRQKQREMGMMRMMSSVPEADVVITNPTHFAVALRYDEDKESAPVIIAKGQDYVASRIRDIARENNVEIVENPPLARTLYFYCDVGDMIPEDMFKAVAEVLAYVYKVKNKRG